MNGIQWRLGKKKKTASQLVERKRWIRNLDAWYEPPSEPNWETSGGNDLQLGNQVTRYFGSTKPVDIMQKWNNDIELYKDTSAVVKPFGIEPAQTPSWKRYHAYVATEGVPIFHEDRYEKIPIRCSKKSTFDSCKGTQYYSCDHFTRKISLILSDW